MPITLAPVLIDQDTRVWIQTSDVQAADGNELVGLTEDLGRRLREAIDAVRPAAAVVLESIKGFNQPKQAEIEFGIGLTSGLDAFIASSSAEVSFKVKLVWENPAGGRSD